MTLLDLSPLSERTILFDLYVSTAQPDCPNQPGDPGNDMSHPDCSHNPLVLLVSWLSELKKKKKGKGKNSKEIWSSRKWHPPVSENVGSMRSAIWATVPTLSDSINKQ